MIYIYIYVFFFFFIIIIIIMAILNNCDLLLIYLIKFCLLSYILKTIFILLLFFFFPFYIPLKLYFIIINKA